MDLSRKKPEVTTAIILEKRVKKKNGTHPVKLRVTFNRNQKYYTSKKHSFTSEDFDAITSTKPRGVFKQAKRELDAIESKAINIIDNVLDEFSFDDFEKAFNSKRNRNNSISSFFDSKIEELKGDNKLQTAISYAAAKKSLFEFDPKITFQKITPKYLKYYEHWMIEKENSYTTVGIYLRNLRHIVNTAIEKGIISQSRYPFGSSKDKYKIPVGNNTKKALSIHEIEKLYKYNPISIQEAKAQAYWFFSYLCNGMNLVDIANLKFKNINGKNIKFIRQKTKDTSIDKKEIIISIIPEIQNIISKFGNEINDREDYIFPIFLNSYSEIEKLNRVKQFIKNTNKYINVIASKVGIDDKITTYWARHSYSTILKNSGASIEFISEQLGHSSIKVTASYLDSFEDDVKEAYQKKLLDF